VRLHHRRGLLGESSDLGRGELGVVEHDAPPDVAQLLRADGGALPALGVEVQRRRGRATGELGRPHVETDRRERRADGAHELPGLVLAQRDLSAA
jgi:hypothetical protein